MSEYKGETITVRVGARLREARLTARLTVREAAARIGLRAHGTLVQYESGRVSPPLDRLAALAQIYGVPLAGLFVSDDVLIPVLAVLEQASPTQIRAFAKVLHHVMEQPGLYEVSGE